MKRLIVIVGFAGLVTAGCGGSGSDLTMTSAERARAEAAQSAIQASPTTMETTTTTTTTVAPAPAVTVPTTPVVACVPVDTTALRHYLDVVESSISQTEGAIAQIQLVIDNGTRDRASAVRYQATVQGDYDKAAAAFNALGWDTNRDRMTYQAGRLADAKDIVASWDATLAKARGDLGRAQTQKATFERKAKETRAQIAAAPSCA